MSAVFRALLMSCLYLQDWMNMGGTLPGVYLSVGESVNFSGQCLYMHA